MARRLRVNDMVVMTENALENYGQAYRGVSFVVERIATQYMPAKEFYAKGSPPYDDYHPGYDDAVPGQQLCDLKDQTTNEDLPFSLYGWELEIVKEEK